MTGGPGSAAGKGRAAVVALLFVSLLAAQAGAQRAFERAWPRRKIDQLLYLPSGRHTKTLTLGFSALAADVLWFKTISYFGGHVLTDHEFPWLFHMLDQVTTLDPVFDYPYNFGGIVLSVERGSAAESIRLLTKAMVRYPGDWRYPFYVGYNAFYNQRDPERAAHFMRHAASLPRSPEYLPRLAASLLAESGRLAAAELFLETMAAGAQDESARASIRQKIEDLRAGRIPAGLKGFLAGKRGP
jgi:hypothetical protein